MGLLSIFKRTEAPASAVIEPADAVQCARTRARQRLIGAAVLVVLGVIGFPLVFETQPRPIPIDIPIDIPRREGAPALTMPAARAPAAPAPTLPPPTAVPDAAAPRPSTASTAAASAPDARPIAANEPPAPSKATARPDAKAEARTDGEQIDGARALALLDGRPASAAAADVGRFIVQVGAFADVAAARETRRKVERMGMKTYTQVANTSAGERIRVRVGPFSSREEADKAMAKAKGAGLGAVVLAL